MSHLLPITLPQVKHRTGMIMLAEHGHWGGLGEVGSAEDDEARLGSRCVQPWRRRNSEPTHRLPHTHHK